MADCSFVVGDGDIREAAEYGDVRQTSGLSAMTLKAAEAGLPPSRCAVTVQDDGRLVALGRVVGDGLHVQVVDIAVRPEFQRREIVHAAEPSTRAKPGGSQP